MSNLIRNIGSGVTLATLSDYQFAIDVSTGAAQIYLPSVQSWLNYKQSSSGSYQGDLQSIRFSDIANLCGTNNITFIAANGDNINTAPSYVVNMNGASGMIMPNPNGNSWSLYLNLSVAPTPPVPTTDFQKIILVDGTYGNDLTAVAYDQLKPFQTIDAAISASENGDLIYINPNLSSPYFVFTNAFSKSVNYYVSKGADVQFFGVNISYSGTADVSIFGEGNITFNSTTALYGDYSGKVTLSCYNITFNANLEVTASWNGDVVINAINKLTLNGFFYYENSLWWGVATKATNFTINAPEVVNNSPVLFVIYPATVQMNINVGIYNSVILFGTKDIWCYGSGSPTYPVVSYINIGKSRADRSTAGYAGSFFQFAFGTTFNKTFITGDYTYIGNGSAGQLPTLIESTANSQTVFFNGVANITKGSMLIDTNSISASGKVQIKGKVNIDNSLVAFTEWLFSCYFISQLNFELLADTIYNSPMNYGLFIGDYSGSTPTPQVDISDCQLVNRDGSGTAPSTIVKGLNAFTLGGTGVAWGNLRIKNVKIINTGVNSIVGGNAGEPMEVYSAYSNKVDTSMTNTIFNIGSDNGLYVNAAISSNNF